MDFILVKFSALKTVNLEIFVKVLFLRNLAYAKFHDIQSFVKVKSSRNVEITLSFIDTCESCLSQEF